MTWPLLLVLALFGVGFKWRDQEHRARVLALGAIGVALVYVWLGLGKL